MTFTKQKFLGVAVGVGLLAASSSFAGNERQIVRQAAEALVAGNYEAFQATLAPDMLQIANYGTFATEHSQVTGMTDIDTYDKDRISSERDAEGNEVKREYTFKVKADQSCSQRNLQILDVNVVCQDWNRSLAVDEQQGKSGKQSEQVAKAKPIGDIDDYCRIGSYSVIAHKRAPADKGQQSSTEEKQEEPQNKQVDSQQSP